MPNYKQTDRARRRLIGLGLGSVAGLAIPSATSARNAPAILGRGIDDGVVRMTRYGYRADGRSDDTSAWRDAIEEAGERNIRRIIVPYSEAGPSIVRHPIIEGKLPAGLTFDGEARSDATPVQEGTRIRYVGSGTCWFINYHDYDPPEIGRWNWCNLTFEASDPTASMFDFNDALNHAPRDGGGHSYLMGATFRNCFIRGAQGGKRQTGDGIRASKLFGLDISRDTRIRDWRRGIWLRGCDDCTISGRIELNARNIQHEQSGTFGSNLQIRSNFIGRCTPEASETTYLLHDSGSGTACHGTFFEGGNGERALLYLDGYATTLLGNRFTMAPFFELGPNAREITLLTPSCPIASDRFKPIIHEPASWDLGYQQQDRRALILGGTKNVRRTIGAHPRIIWRDNFPQYSDSGRALPISQEGLMIADANGYRPARRLLNALNYWAKTEGTLAQGGATLKQDMHASGGWTICIDSAVEYAGIAAEFFVGTDVQPDDELKITFRYQARASGWEISTQRNAEAPMPLLELSEAPSEYERATCSIRLAKWRRGETLTVLVRPGKATGLLKMDFAEFAIAVPELANVGSIHDDKRHTRACMQKQVSELTDRVNMLLEMLKQRGDMSG